MLLQHSQRSQHGFPGAPPLLLASAPDFNNLFAGTSP